MMASSILHLCEQYEKKTVWYQLERHMDTELLTRCKDLDDARHDTASRADLKRRKLWGAAYTIRGMDVPDMSDEIVELLVELAFLSILPAYRNLTLMTYSTALQSMSDDYKKYFAHMVKLARRLDTHGDDELATDEDWIAWMESM